MWLSLARAPDLGSGGRRFESCHPDYGSLAQSVEHLTFNQVVPGSIPGWLSTKPVNLRFTGFFVCIILSKKGLLMKCKLCIKIVIRVDIKEY